MEICWCILFCNRSISYDWIRTFNSSNDRWKSILHGLCNGNDSKDRQISRRAEKKEMQKWSNKIEKNQKLKIGRRHLLTQSFVNLNGNFIQCSVRKRKEIFHYFCNRNSVTTFLHFSFLNYVILVVVFVFCILFLLKYVASLFDIHIIRSEFHLVW